MLPTYDVKQDIMMSRLGKQNSFAPLEAAATIQKISKIPFMASNHMTIFY
jgi:hypothetical protein